MREIGVLLIGVGLGVAGLALILAMLSLRDLQRKLAPLRRKNPDDKA